MIFYYYCIVYIMTFVLQAYEDRMQKALAYLGDEFAKLQAGRATPGLVDNIRVDPGYGVMPMNQVANIVVMDNSTIKIEPWDKTIMAAIEKAIYDANTGLTPQGMGDYVMIKIPALTQERRQQIVKQVHSYGEDAKVSVRQVRQDARDDVRTLADADEISEDQQHAYEADIDALTKTMNTHIEDAVKQKENTVMGG
jgi:ribosome recycling factor